MSDAVAFHLHEYDYLSDLHLDLIKWGNNNFTLALVSSGVVFSWSLLNRALIDGSRFGFLVTYLPLVLTGTLGLISFFAYQRLKATAEYMAKLEEHLGLSELGWCKWIRSRPRFLMFRNFVAVAWLTLLLLDLLTPLFLL